jgi:hypothetical protein
MIVQSMGAHPMKQEINKTTHKQWIYLETVITSPKRDIVIMEFSCNENSKCSKACARIEHIGRYVHARNDKLPPILKLDKPFWRLRLNRAKNWVCHYTGVIVQ